jgi:hypothetical protein
MINWTDSNIVWAEGRPIVKAQIPLITEGMGMVSAFENGIVKAQPATGATTDGFIGIAMGPRKTFQSDALIESVVVPASGPYTVLLKNTAVGTVGVYGVSGALIASTSSAASTTNVQATVDSTTGLTLLTFDSSFAGAAFNVAYNYTMSQVQSAKFGVPSIGPFAEETLGAAQMFLIGRIVVNNFSPTANWYASGALVGPKLVAGGIWTDPANAATGIIPANVRVVAIPTPANPWLTLEVR